MHDVDDFILPVTTRFQNRASLDGWTTDAPRTERAPRQQQPQWLQPSSSRGETLHTDVRDDTKFPHAVELSRGNRKTPPATSGMDSPCGMQHAHATPEVAVRDESKSVDAAQSNRGYAKMPLDTAIVDSPRPQQAHDTPHAAPVSSGNAAAQRPDTPLVHSMQSDDNSDLLIRHDGFIDSNCAVDNNNSLTDVTFPAVSYTHLTLPTILRV